MREHRLAAGGAGRRPAGAPLAACACFACVPRSCARATRTPVLLTCLVVVAAALVAGCGPKAARDTRPPKTVKFEARVAAGVVEGGVQHWRLQKNDTMQIAVSSDASDTLVLEDYGQKLPINAGATATITRPATKLGTSKVLLGRSKVQVAALTVTR